MSEETPEYGTARRRFDDCLETAKEDLFTDKIKRLEIALQRTTALRIAFIDYFINVEDAGELEQQLIGKVVIGEVGLMARIIRLEKERDEFLDSKREEGVNE